MYTMALEVSKRISMIHHGGNNTMSSPTHMELIKLLASIVMHMASKLMDEAISYVY